MGCSLSSSVEVKENNPQARNDGEKEENAERKTQEYSKSSISVAGYDFNYFQNIGLFAHNHYREQHGAPPLKLNKALCDMAEQLARRMARSEQLDRSPTECRLHGGQVCGENMFWREENGLPLNGDDVVKSWYNERHQYNFDDPKYVEAAAHFTQLIWCGTKEFGMATADSEKGSSAVAVYFPHGNVEGQYAENVKLQIKTS